MPLMPAAFDLNQVPVGSWAEYSWGLQGLSRFERVAVVARGPDGITIESRDDGAMFNEQVVTSSTYEGDDVFRGEFRRSVFQMGSDAPMEGPMARRYARVDPSKLIGTETVTVRAGTFTAKHYRDRTVFGEQVDFWIADAVMPFGVVKLESEQKQNPQLGDRFVAELLNTGSDAVPLITQPARPFDAEYLKKKGQQLGAARAAKKPGPSP